MRKRLFILGILFLALIVPLTAAGQGEMEKQPTPDKKQTITMWFFGTPDRNRVLLQEHLIDRFNAENPNSELVIEYRNSVDSDLVTALLANQGPDILYGSSPAMVMNLILAGKYEDLTPYAKKYGWDEKLLKVFYDSGSVDGKLYNIPMGMNLTGIYYYETTFEENGWEKPETIQDMISIMDSAKEKGLYAGVAGNKGWQPVNEDYASMFLTSFAGPNILYRALKGGVPWTSEEIINAIETSADWYKKGYLGGTDYTNLNYSDCATLFQQKRAAFLIGPSRIYQNIVRVFTSEEAEKVHFMPLPVSDDAPYAIGTTGILGINKNSKNKDLASKVLAMIVDEKFVKAMSEKWPGYWGVPLTSLKESDFSNLNGASKSFLQALQKALGKLESGKFGYYVSSFFPPETYNEFVNIDTVWLGTRSSIEMLNKVDEVFKKELQKGIVPSTPAPGK